MPNILKLITEVGPLLLFFIAYKYSGLVAATSVIVVSTLITQAFTYYFEKKISPIQIFTTALLLVFGGITIYSGNSMFIKLKPTIINLLFAIILLAGVFLKRGYIKYIFGNAISMSEENWLILSRRLAIFFLALACLNEVVWRNVAEHVWVNFKVFGILGCTIIFLFIQIPFLSKNNIK